MTNLEFLMAMDDAEREAKEKVLALSDNPLERANQIVKEFTKAIMYEKEIKRLTKENEEWKEKHDALDEAGVLLCRTAIPGEENEHSR
jgi:hypothetical protein